MGHKEPKKPPLKLAGKVREALGREVVRRVEAGDSGAVERRQLARRVAVVCLSVGFTTFLALVTAALTTEPVRARPAVAFLVLALALWATACASAFAFIWHDPTYREELIDNPPGASVVIFGFRRHATRPTQSARLLLAASALCLAASAGAFAALICAVLALLG